MNTTEQEFWAEVALLIKPVVVPDIEYRLHYNSDGTIYLCTMQQHPDNTTYLVVDKDTYDRYFEYTVVDGKLVKNTSKINYHVQLLKSDKGFCVVKGHAGLLLEPGETFEEIEYYARTR